MSPRERPVDRGTRLAHADLVRVGADLREARIAAGLSTARVGAAIQLSGTQVGRIERAVAPAATVRQLARIGAVVGLHIRIQAYPGQDPLRDAGQLALLDRLRARLAPTLTFRTEVPLASPGDQRAWDAVIGRLVPGSGGRMTLPAEAETRFTDAQGQLRRLALKMRDDDQPAVLLVLADTTRNRAAIAAAGSMISERFPISARAALAALREGRHPAASALIFL
jgi:transcriptional regulator with XRE-family HTH domain